MSPGNRKSVKTNPPKRRGKGFAQTGSLVQSSLRKATEKRGFVEIRLLTHWPEIVGEATASICRPVKVGYGRQGFGATLTLLTNGANAPILQAELPKIRERVNACYGYAAISQIRLAQTAATGFAEAQVEFRTAPPPDRPRPNPTKVAELETQVATIESNALRSALAALGRNILTRSKD